MMPKNSTYGEYSALSSEEEIEEEQLLRRNSTRLTRRGAPTAGDVGQSLSRDVLTDCIFVSAMKSPNGEGHGDTVNEELHRSLLPEMNPSVTTGTAGTNRHLIPYYTSSDLKSMSDTPVPKPRSEDYASMITEGAGHTVVIPAWFQAAPQESPPRLPWQIQFQAAPQESPPRLPWQIQTDDLERGYVAATELSPQQQTQDENLEVNQSIPQQHGPQTDNQNMVGGDGSGTQEDKGKTKKDDPASDIIHLVMVLLSFYMVMLGYLSWGPTSRSPRESYTIYFWVSIGMLAYVAFTLFGVLRMHKIGGAWTWWARFFSFTIYAAAIIGSVMLIVLVSRH